MNLHDDQPEQGRSDEYRLHIETGEVGMRVTSRYRFGEPGTVVGAHNSWVWVMWDEYPPEHEPCTHHVAELRESAL